MTFSQMIVDLFQHGHPTAVIGFLLICAMLIAAPSLLIAGAWQAYYNDPARRMRRRLDRTLARRRRR